MTNLGIFFVDTSYVDVMSYAELCIKFIRKLPQRWHCKSEFKCYYSFVSSVSILSYIQNWIKFHKCGFDILTPVHSWKWCLSQKGSLWWRLLCEFLDFLQYEWRICDYFSKKLYIQMQYNKYIFFLYNFIKNRPERRAVMANFAQFSGWARRMLNENRIKSPNCLF